MPASTHVHIPQCQHIRASGMRCGSPALRGKSHCHYHALHLRAESQKNPPLPVPEDAASIQLALHQVIRGVANGRFDRKQAALLLYALQIAQTNLKLLKRESEDAAFEQRVTAMRERGLNPYDGPNFSAMLEAVMPAIRRTVANAPRAIYSQRRAAPVARPQPPAPQPAPATISEIKAQAQVEVEAAGRPTRSRFSVLRFPLKPRAGLSGPPGVQFGSDKINHDSLPRT